MLSPILFCGCCYMKKFIFTTLRIILAPISIAAVLFFCLMVAIDDSLTIHPESKGERNRQLFQ